LLPVFAPVAVLHLIVRICRELATQGINGEYGDTFDFELDKDDQDAATVLATER